MAIAGKRLGNLEPNVSLLHNGNWIKTPGSLRGRYKQSGGTWQSLWGEGEFDPGDAVYFDGTVHGLIDGGSDLETQRHFEFVNQFWNFNSWFRMDSTGEATLFRMNDVIFVGGNLWVTFRIYRDAGGTWRIYFELPTNLGDSNAASGITSLWKIDQAIPGMNAALGEWFNLGITTGENITGLESGELYDTGYYPRTLKIWYNGTNVIDFRIPSGTASWLNAWSPGQTGRWCFFCNTEKTNTYEGYMAKTYLWGNTFDAGYRDVEMDDTDAATLYNGGVGLDFDGVAAATKSGTTLSLARYCVWAPDYSTAPASGITGAVSNNQTWLQANSTLYGTTSNFETDLLVSDPLTSGTKYEDVLSQPGSGVLTDWPL